MSATAVLLAVAMTVAAVLAAWRRVRWRPGRKDAAALGPAARRRRRGPLLAVVALIGLQALCGAPAFAQDFSCKEPPNPERPGAGMVGAIDPAPITVGLPHSPYADYGYAGMVWHTYDLGCGPTGVTSPNAVADTWVGNELFNVGKNLVGATNGLHYALLSGNLLAPLDDLITTGTVALYDSVFAPWFGVAALILAVLLFRYIWTGDLASIGKRGTWALAGLWFASATYLTPLVYTHALDEVVITGTSAVQAGFLQEIGMDQRDALPTLLHNEVIHRNWLRGEFGSPDAPQAKQLGGELLWAQAWTKSEVNSGADAGSPDAKKAAYEDVAAKSGSAYGYFKGTDGSRIGAGLLAFLQGFAYASFQLLAKAAILLAQVLLRVLILAGPLIGLVALLYHEVLRSVGRLAGAAMLNVVVISALAGLHAMLLNWVFNPTRGFSLLTQMMLAGLVTIVFFMVGRPLRRITQMVELSVGTAGGALPRVPPGMLSRFRRRDRQPTAQDDFWDEVRNSEFEDVPGEGAAAQHRGRRRSRPEADHPSVSATAERMDYPGGASGFSGAGTPPGSPPLGGGPGTQSPLASGRAEQQYRAGVPRHAGALPEGRTPSRVVDTAPVVESKWDLHDEDAVLVPSNTGDRPWQVEDPVATETPRQAPRRAEMEVVAGKPVYVVYRPSRGLEVADDTHWA